MCVQIAYEDKIYASPRELSAILPNGYAEDRRFTYPAGSEADPDACLCQLDLGATAERNGFDAEWSSPARVILVFTRKGDVAWQILKAEGEKALAITTEAESR